MVRHLFSQDSAFARVLALLADVAVVSMSLTLTAIPVVTFGAGLAAANVVVGQLIADDGAHPWRTFWRIFVRSLKMATVGWLLLLACWFTVIYELMLLHNETGLFVDGMRIGLFSVAILSLLVAQWFFALAGHANAGLSTSENRAHKQTAPTSFVSLLTTSLLCAIRYLPASALGMALWASPIFAAWIWPELVPTLIFFMAVFIPAFVLYLKTLVIGGKVREVVCVC
ncbi:DUF624 domain-containing protein [Arcanobacterium canis]